MKGESSRVTNPVENVDVRLADYFEVASADAESDLLFEAFIEEMVASLLTADALVMNYVPKAGVKKYRLTEVFANRLEDGLGDKPRRLDLSDRIIALTHSELGEIKVRR